MLDNISIRNYRNLHLETGISFDSLAILVGPNGSGKSNMVRILEFLRDALTGSPDERRGIDSFEDAVARFGAGRILDVAMTMPAVVSFDFHFRIRGGGSDGFYLELEILDDNTAVIHREEMYRESESQPFEEREYYYRAHVPARGLGYVGNAREGWTARDPTGGGAGGYVLLPGAISMMPEGSHLAFRTFSQELERILANPSFPRPEGYEAIVRNFYDGRDRLMEQVSGWTFYESGRMNLHEIRHAKPELGVTDSVLSPTGGNLPVVLHNLMGDHPDFEDEIDNAMRELFPRSSKLRVPSVGRSTLELRWHLKDNSKPFYLDEMSDGTVRMLCWAVVLFSPKRPTLIVLDEPEAGIHPAWLRVLAGWIRNAARQTQVIVSTHSSDLLDYFTEDLANVRVFRPDREDPRYNTVAELDPRALAQKLHDGWKLGDLYRVGDPSVGGWPW